MMNSKPMIDKDAGPLFDDAPRPDAPVSGEPQRREVLEASNRLSRLVRLGTLDYGRASWRGSIYSPSSGAVRMKGLDGLSVLARTPWLGCVSLERGYLHPYSQAELAAASSVVPADFRFIVRAPPRTFGRNQPGVSQCGCRSGIREKLHRRARRKAGCRAL